MFKKKKKKKKKKEKENRAAAYLCFGNLFRFQSCINAVPTQLGMCPDLFPVGSLAEAETLSDVPAAIARQG